MFNFFIGLLTGGCLTVLFFMNLEMSQRKSETNPLKGFDPKMQFHRQLQVECPEGHARVGELCDLPGIWICVERFKEAEVIAWVDEDQEGDLYEYPSDGPTSYGRQVASNEYLSALDDEGVWVEQTIGDCRYGCKIYENSVTHERALAHNSTYGCNK